jgi:aspartate kinase
MRDLIVAKFGGTSVATPESRQAVIRQLARLRSAGPVIAVVSAMGRRGAPYATDTLLSLLRSDADPLVRDQLISCGETISACIVADELSAAGIPARPFTAHTAEIRTDDRPGEADIMEIGSEKLAACLKEGVLPVVTGFQGILPDGHVTTLGRGGSDTSAVEIGGRMGAKEVLIFTDVPGVAAADPRIWPEAPYRKSVSYEDMEALAKWGAAVIHPRAVAAGKRFGVPVRVLSTWEEGDGTLICAPREPETGLIGAAIRKSSPESVLTVLARPFPAVPEVLLPEGAVCTREADLLQIRIPEAAAPETLRRVCGFLQKEYAEDSL